MTTIHPTAIVHPKAQLDDDVHIQAYTVIGEHVSIGAGTVIGPHCVIEGRSEIGKNNQIFSGAQLGVLCQDLKHKAGLVGRFQMGDNNVIREHVTISSSTMSSYDDDHRMTIIGNSCLLMACSHVGHDCHIGNHVIMPNCSLLAGHVDVEDHARLGALSAVHQECVIGKMSFVGGLSAVTKDVPPFMIVSGNPARCGGPNTVGLRRYGLDEDARARIKAMYKIMCRSELNTTQAIHEIEATVEDCDERAHFVEFFRRSIRGVTK